MSRLADIRRFYGALEQLAGYLGRPRRLRDCDGRMGWPERGLYFFFESGEVRVDSGQGLRVVRVGTHALTATSRTSLWTRLKQHQGHLTGAFSGGGNHRGSVFRLHVGAAIARREGLDVASWAKGSSASSLIRRAEHELECLVSKHIRAMPFLWLDVTVGEDGGRVMRRHLEANSIALLSNMGRPGSKGALDPPSADWLGNFCPNASVVRSGLWNVNHVADNYDAGFLDVLERQVTQVVAAHGSTVLAK